ncbi:hypothetical protein [Pseudomonas rhodesiae]|uniref:hypothetical protein n=1 Tax=Pseudomonas rhodesiae TaxID=76760 RepID=UPI0028A996A2|nr:hypothetical protein [Pseudomonas rhodesiae]
MRNKLSLLAIAISAVFSSQAFADGFDSVPTPESARGDYSFSFSNQIYVSCQGGITVKGEIPLQTWVHWDGAVSTNTYYGVEQGTSNFYKVLMVQGGAYFPNFTPEETRRMGGTVENVNGVVCESPNYYQKPSYAYDIWGVEHCPSGQTVGGVEGGYTARWGSVPVYFGMSKEGVGTSYLYDKQTKALTPFNYDDYPSLNEDPDYALPGSVIDEHHGEWDADSQQACAPVRTSTIVTETRAQACEVGESGSRTESRTVKVTSEGGTEVAREAISDWTVSESTCVAMAPEPQPEPEQPEPEPAWASIGAASVSFTCPAGQTVGGLFGAGSVRQGTLNVYQKGSEYGLKGQEDTFKPVAAAVDANGVITLTGVAESDVDSYGKWLSGSEAACAEPTQFQPVDDYKTETVTCAEAQVGHVTYAYNRRYEINNATGETRNDTGWLQSVQENTCKDLEDALLEEKETSLEEACPNGQAGTVIVTGKTVTYGLSGSKFIETSRTENCVADIDTFDKETQTEACPTGQTGSIELYRIKAKKTDGSTIYPYGEEYVQSQNTCVSATVQPDSTTGSAVAAKGLLSNQTIKASDTTSIDRLISYLDVVTDVDRSIDYKLNIVLDSFSKANIAKLETVSAKWKQVSEGKVILSDAPHFADAYAGFGGITQANASSYVINSAIYVEGSFKVSAKKVGGLKGSQAVSFTVPFAKIAQ